MDLKIDAFSMYRWQSVDLSDIYNGNSHLKWVPPPDVKIESIIMIEKKAAKKMKQFL